MKPIKYYVALVEREIEVLHSIKYGPDSLHDPIVYAMSGGGKRLRPVLMLAVADALGADPHNFVRTAFAIEMFHNFTLLHDDIMDHSDTRHGRPSVPARFGEAAAILSGDAMLTASTILVGESRELDDAHRVRITNSFNITAMRVYAGQALDMEMEGRENVTEAEYFHMIGRKTSALISGACHLGALCADANEEVAGSFIEYGDNLGIAFQLQDDLLDTFGDAATFGKPIGGDILNDKNTWLRVVALQEAHDAMTAASSLHGDDKIKAVREIYEQLNLPARCEVLISDYTDRAIDALRHVELSEEAREFFSSLALNLLHRKK